MNWMLSVRAWSFNGTNGTTASLIFVPDVPVPDHFSFSILCTKREKLSYLNSTISLIEKLSGTLEQFILKLVVTGFCCSRSLWNKSGTSGTSDRRAEKGTGGAESKGAGEAGIAV